MMVICIFSSIMVKCVLIFCWVDCGVLVIEFFDTELKLLRCSKSTLGEPGGG